MSINLHRAFSCRNGIAALGDEAAITIHNLVRSYDDFTEDNDPYGEHDFGSFIFEGRKIFWKIDYYDINFRYLSEDPANPHITKRVLTIMLADEY